jgi:ribosome biogenesis ATPase
MGGVEPCLQAIRELIEWPLAHPEVYGHLGVDAPRGVLLHGPPGCGKTLLANAIAGELGVPFFKLSATEVVAGTSGESERLIRSLFEEAKANAPSLLFIDEVDAITPKRENAQREMEKRIVAQLLTSMDELKPDQRAPNAKPIQNSEDGGGGEDGGEAKQATGEDGEGGGDGRHGDEEEGEGEGAVAEMSDFPKNVIVIGATNRPDAIDPALRRAGRFDREIALGIPDEAARARILSTLARGLRVSDAVSWPQLARSTPGFVGADLKALTREAATIAIKRIFGDLGSTKQQQQQAPQQLTTQAEEGSAAEAQPAGGDSGGGAGDSGDGGSLLVGVGEEMLSPSQLSPLSIDADDFEQALGHVQPSSQREGFATIPDVSFDDVGALVDVRAELEMAIVQPVLQPEKFAAFGLTPNAGVLLYGPPGCGKTLVAKAIAHHAKVNFISIKGPELLNKYVGESERAVRQVFSRGRASAPCVIFFDELDALVPKRSGEGTSSSERVVNQLLTELDGADPRENVFIIAATNRPDLIDPAMLRPGRLDKLLYVPFPEAEERKDILRALTSKMPLSAAVDLGVVANDKRTEGFSGADLAGLTREAAIMALKESMAADVQHAAAAAAAAAAAVSAGGAAAEPSSPSAAASVEARHFEAALANTFPSVSARDRRAYAGLKKKLGRCVRTPHCPLPTAHCPLPTAHCPLPTAHCPLLCALPSVPACDMPVL